MEMQGPQIADNLEKKNKVGRHRLLIRFIIKLQCLGQGDVYARTG